MGIIFVDGFFGQSGCASFGDMLGLNNGGGVATDVSAHTTWCCAPSKGSRTLGWRKALVTVATSPSP